MKVAERVRVEDSQILARRAAQVQRGGARAAVLGINDGLVSVLCIVLGVAAAGADQHAVLLAGFAGLVAGAFSMSAGEWISVKAQVQLFEGVLDDLRKMIKRDKTLLMENLRDHLVEDGYDKKTASEATVQLASKNEIFYTTYAEQVVGINPDELGSPWVAAFSSFALFVVGALAPLAPWFFIDGQNAVIISIVLTALASLVVGGYVANTSGKKIIVGALRQLGIVIFASAITYGIGYLFGVTVL
jgi:vacuolar iron transporter family protein